MYIKSFTIKEITIFARKKILIFKLKKLVLEDMHEK